MKPNVFAAGLSCVMLWLLLPVTTTQAGEQQRMILAAAESATPPADDQAEKELSPEEKMARRFPQPVRAGDLIGLPALDWNDSTIGFIREVVRTSEGKIQLIVPYRRWFGWAPAWGVFDWGRRPVAVPLEAVAILARQVDVLDMERADFDKSPTFTGAGVERVAADEKFRIAVTRR